ncbi:2-dehydropantoate 2-reductase [Burkholderiaceae bacterium FT117]|uniref:ketopantoate reductase family protein n=1 Tax=Zeimonas sediminis TaxID=2944268 RepID=UPI002342C139|nr:2-dehydropantoate 2-reductase [Zeimonas sediminis]MCM5572072.1 2-dehydropantoate 2-reductase [Zeimonas sediminis]
MSIGSDAGDAGTSWPRVAVFGAGAVGCHFGAKLAEAGVPVTLIARPAHVDAIRKDGLLFESGGQQRRIAISADTSPEPVRDADVVLFCVKTRDTTEGARSLVPLLKPGATVVSMQNGVDNVPKMREAGVDALGAVVYVAASMPGPGHLLHSGRGDLVVGEYGSAQAPSARAAAVSELFERAGVRCKLVADVRGELWTKLVMNCVFNAMSAVGRSRYGPLVERPDTRAVARDLVDECVSVAKAEGVPLADADTLYEAALKLGQAMAPATSSTEQDLSLGRPTEIDSLNGYVAARGEALGVATPVNRALAAMVRLLDVARR